MVAKAKRVKILRETLILLSVLFFLFVEPIPQSPEFHDFADRRTILGIPNFFDVISNLPFLIVGVWGLIVMRSRETVFGERWEKTAFYVIFGAIALVFFGSSYFHLEPNNERLYWDRFPMTIAFMSIYSTLIGERIDVEWGKKFLWPSIAVGIAAVTYWAITESRGSGDLRFYILVQFIPVLSIPFLLLFFDGRYTGTHYWAIVIACYIGAKILEVLDWQIYAVGGIISGHSLKHVLAGVGTAFLIPYIQKRKRL